MNRDILLFVVEGNGDGGTRLVREVGLYPTTCVAAQAGSSPAPSSIQRLMVAPRPFVYLAAA